MMSERKFMEELKSKAKIENFISKLEPEMPVMEVAVGDAPFKGPSNAKVTIVEFTDFKCPYCSRAHETMERILSEYKDKVKFVRKDYPLVHPAARIAHMASHCAGEQSKYWEYTDVLWKNSSKLEKDNLKKFAKDLMLDIKKFNECLDSNKYMAKIEKDMEQGKALGIRGTPSFFINGKNVSGAQPYENFKEVIDKEL